MSLIRLPELLALLGGVGKTTLQSWEAKGNFPKRIRIGERAVAWDRRAVEAFLASRPTVTVNCKDDPRKQAARP